MTGERMSRRPRVLLTLVMHLVRGIGRLQALYAKALPVAPTAP
jgi:hypothetical protein